MPKKTPPDQNQRGVDSLGVPILHPCFGFETQGTCACRTGLHKDCFWDNAWVFGHRQRQSLKGEGLGWAANNKRVPWTHRPLEGPSWTNPLLTWTPSGAVTNGSAPSVEEGSRQACKQTNPQSNHDVTHQGPLRTMSVCCKALLSPAVEKQPDEWVDGLPTLGMVE